MFWGGFGNNGTTPLAQISTRLDSEGYQDILKDNLLPYGTKIGGRGWIFQQDNASIHASTSTSEWCRRKNLRLLPWPSKSPDLNPIENLGGMLTRIV